MSPWQVLFTLHLLSLNRYSLGTYSGPGAVLSAEDSAEDQAGRYLPSGGLTGWQNNTVIKQVSTMQNLEISLFVTLLIGV